MLFNVRQYFLDVVHNTVQSRDAVVVKQRIPSCTILFTRVFWSEMFESLLDTSFVLLQKKQQPTFVIHGLFNNVCLELSFNRWKGFHQFYLWFVEAVFYHQSRHNDDTT